MNITLFAPENRLHFGISAPYQSQSQGLMVVAALTPARHNVKIFDFSQSKIDFSIMPDLAGITYTCSSRAAAFQLADQYRSLRVPVVLGGPEATAFPDEAQAHADTVVIGEADSVWEALLKDYECGVPKPRYQATVPAPIDRHKYPRYDLYDNSRYFNVLPAYTSQGCPYRCAYCNYWKQHGAKIRVRPVEEVTNQIKFMKSVVDTSAFPLSINFTDDNIWCNPAFAKKLFRELKKLDISWWGQGSVTMDEELFSLARESGCQIIFIGFESLNSENLKALNKKQNRVENYAKQIDLMHRAGLNVGGFFMVGLPYDCATVFDDLMDFIMAQRIETPIVNLFEPYRGTDFYNTYHWDGKEQCLHWEDTAPFLPVFTPEGITRKTFRQQFVKFSRAVYADAALDHRLGNCGIPSIYFMNTGMKEVYNKPLMDAWIEKGQTLESRFSLVSPEISITS
jgi:radical SAM superfamily enzyme YgiQ (UPF0313 family)